jgi:NitT/TauT family transport system substrate-binding protein
LKLTLDMNVLTPWVKANGYGGIDQARWNTAIDQIGLTFNFKDKAKAAAAFDASFLPPAADRKID